MSVEFPTLLNISIEDYDFKSPEDFSLFDFEPESNTKIEHNSRMNQPTLTKKH